MYRDFGIGTIQSWNLFFFLNENYLKIFGGRKSKIEPIQSFLLEYIILKYGIFN